MYVIIESGEHFGHVDFALEPDMFNFQIVDGKKKKSVRRLFTIQAVENCEMFTLKIEDLEKMRIEFPECFLDLFKDANERLQKELILKYEVIKR
jgi:hypothetical protein